MLKTLNHMVNVMTGQNLANFSVPQNSRLEPGCDLGAAKITPVSQMPILKLVPRHDRKNPRDHFL